jgi:glycosyltransferase involved in cell wall biosynthesis
MLGALRKLLMTGPRENGFPAQPTRRVRIAFVVNALPYYRADFFRRVMANEAFDCHVFCQETVTGTRIPTVHGEFPGRVTLLKVASYKGDRMQWQWLPLGTILGNFDICVIIGNPRCVSSVVLSFALRALDVPTVIWGQAHTAGASPRTERIRHAWWRCFRYLFVYTDADVEYLRVRGFGSQTIVGMNNGLDQDRIDAAAARWDAERLATWRRAQGLENRSIVLSCARLTAKNEMELMIDALPALLETRPDLVWCILGDGPEGEKLKQRARERHVEKAIRWMGSLYVEEELAPWFLSSITLLHPGAIGLSLLHAFGYGLPVITHDDRRYQMPEIAALKDGENGLLFRHGDVADMARVLCWLLDHPERRASLSQRALLTARTQYNSGIMAQRFEQLVRVALARS